MILDQIKDQVFFDEADLHAIFNDVWAEILEQKNEHDGCGYAQVSMRLTDLLTSFRRASFKLIAQVSGDYAGISPNFSK